MQVWVSVHYACPFGALSSVHGWERTGRLLTTLARKILHLPTDRYVDGFIRSGKVLRNCFCVFDCVHVACLCAKA